MENTTSFTLTFLGTCACDFSEKLENEFKDKLDYDARRSSSVLIDEAFLIDAGTHILDSLRITGKKAEEITDILITHLHSDHFDIESIKKIAQSKKFPLRLWVREDALLSNIENVTVMKMKPYESYKLSNDISITAIRANHDPSSFPQHFLIEKRGSKIYYACDGAWMLTEAFNFLKNAQLDVAIIDCTVGDYIGDYRIAEHNSIPMIRLMLPSLKTEKIITEKTRVLLSHIAPSLHKPHKEIQEIAKAFGVDVAYDGLRLTI